MAAHKISHVVLTCPPFTLELRETQRTIAQTMVTTPTMKMTAMLNFSTSDIRSVKSTRSGMAITAEGQQSSMLNPLNTVEEQKRDNGNADSSSRSRRPLRGNTTG
jgi:exopolysaccharide biosynthesis protein